MKCNKVLLCAFLIVSFSIVYGQSNYDKEQDDSIGQSDENDSKCEDRSNCDDDKPGKDNEMVQKDEDDVKEKDEDEKYTYEPCDFIDDVDCVRHFFSTYSECKVPPYYSKKPVYREKFIDYLPNINLTIVSLKTRITNLDGKIERFYINKTTGNLVFSVGFDNITLQMKKAIFYVARRGQEPAMAADRANGTYPITFTAIIPIVKGLSIKDTIVTNYLPNPFPEFHIGPKVINSKDPDVARSVAGLYADIPTALKEFFLNEGPNLFLAYLQRDICDFGLPISL